MSWWWRARGRGGGIQRTGRVEDSPKYCRVRGGCVVYVSEEKRVWRIARESTHNLGVELWVERVNDLGGLFQKGHHCLDPAAGGEKAAGLRGRLGLILVVSQVDNEDRAAVRILVEVSVLCGERVVS